MRYRVEMTDETEDGGIAFMPFETRAGAMSEARRLSRYAAKHGGEDGVYVVASDGTGDVGHIAYYNGRIDHRDGVTE